MPSRPQVLKIARQWHPLAAELHGLAADRSTDLLALSAAELEDLRSQAERLASALAAWQAACRPHRRPTTSERV